MRRITVFQRVSADGLFAGPDGGLDWVVPEPELDREGAAATPLFDTILFGRRTYEIFEQAWRRDDEDAPRDDDPHDPGRRSDAMREMGRMLNASKKIVFSTSLTDVSWKNTRLLRRIDRDELDALRRAPGKGIIVFGSGTIVSQLTELGCIDEYQLVVSPVLLGAGRPLLRDVTTRTRLELLESKVYRSGNVMLRFGREESRR